MASPSPVKTSIGVNDISISTTPLSSASSKSSRGLNKPKCIKCGNVARSRCPYQSCKNCCAKAQNPCHIHVLKGTSSLPEKPPSSSSPLFDQQSTDASHSGNTHRLRQLSSNFAQFSSLQTPLRSRKPITKKDAQALNEWRFLKLREFRDQKSAAENEAFDRYMQNVLMLEEVFMIPSASDNELQENQPSGVNSSADGENIEDFANNLKLKLRSNLVRSDNFRKRIEYVVDQGLKKLVADQIDGNDDINDTVRSAKKIKSVQGENEADLSDLFDKLNKARSEDDLKECWEMASQIYRWNSKMSQNPDYDSCSQQHYSYSAPKWISTVTIKQESLCQVDAEFSSLEEIEDL